jgi:hypothetical protein
MEDGKVMSGTLLVKGKKFHQTTVIPGDDLNIKADVISDGEYVYTWTDMAKGTGFKVKIEDTQKEAATAQQNNQQVDWNKKMDYNCSPSTVSDADVTPPTNIDFSDFTDTMNKLKDLDVDALKKQFGGQ